VAEELDIKQQIVSALVDAGWATVAGDMTVCQAHEVAETVSRAVVRPLLWRMQERQGGIESSRQAWAEEAMRLEMTGPSKDGVLGLVEAVLKGNVYTITDYFDSEGQPMKVVPAEDIDRVVSEVSRRWDAPAFRPRQVVPEPSGSVCACPPKGVKIRRPWTPPQCAVHPANKPKPYPEDLFPGCPCKACVPADTDPWSFHAQMHLCPHCGNKRCPGAADHTNECSGSNEPGQVGSLYGPPAASSSVLLGGEAQPSDHEGGVVE